MDKQISTSLRERVANYIKLLEELRMDAEVDRQFAQSELGRARWDGIIQERVRSVITAKKYLEG